MQERETIVLRLVPPRGDNEQARATALRLILKIIGRRFGFRCIECRTEKSAA